MQDSTWFLDNKTLLSIFCILRIGRDIKRSGRYSFFSLKAYGLSGKAKLIKGTFVK